MKRAIITGSLIVVYIACGVFDYGVTLKDFTAKFPDQINTDAAWSMALGGPFAIPAVLIDAGFPLKFQFHAYSTEQRWQIFHQKYPDLGRDYFEGR